ncbi:hypothetical protein ACET3Z_005126 [Daucus carota]
MMKTWEATVCKTQVAAKRRASTVFGTTYVAHASDDESEAPAKHQSQAARDIYVAKRFLPNAGLRVLCTKVNSRMDSRMVTGEDIYLGLNGDLYGGSCIMNLKHGYDFKESLNMDKYEGDWCHGLQEEKGKYQCENENSYVEEQRNGRICEKGKLHWAKGNGTFECPDGSFYV